ncbi:DUF2786 domain-containing protein [Geobacter sp. SVR]|uniref:DUF7168 domain-containing protein n=1 Tax=Geobacter sp. SVR TaxID=2495594 RepID=UPI00143EF9A2|nr:DUF2786 domain-containing protein [Geobacter sp. SVR]BCS55168.1 hypothetical protein GSVR_34760 [Geobacter sp. SVR]GCF85349.1 hypothetical protein GSbR_19490 [Geobacter sp. SVR]
MKNREAIIDKIRKLLRLANSSNEHEAALAAARAQELLAKHNLDEAELTEREIPKEAGVASVDNVVKKPASWVYLLASAVAGAFDCKYFHSPYHGRVSFVGVDLDHEVASFTFGYLYRTINRLAAEFMGKSQQRRLTAKGKKKVRLSYCLGCTHIVSQKLREQHERTPITTTALVPIKEALIKQRMADFGIVETDLDEDNLSDRAYWAGRRDGAGIDHGRRAVRDKKAWPLRIEHRS